MVGPLLWDHEGWLRHKRQRHNVLICLSRESPWRQSSYQVAFRSHLVGGAGQFHADKCKMCGQDFVGSSSGESPFWGSGISMSLYEKIQSTPCKERVQSTFNSLCKDAKFITNVKVPDSVWAFDIQTQSVWLERTWKNYSDSTLFYRTCTAPWRVADIKNCSSLMIKLPEIQSIYIAWDWRWDSASFKKKLRSTSWTCCAFKTGKATEIQW